MDKIGKIQGLDILTYLRNSGVPVDETLCAVVPDEIVKKTGKSKCLCVIDILCDDKRGTLSHQFPDYYNRFPEETVPTEIHQLKEAFQIFIQKILFGKKEDTGVITTPAETQPVRDILSDNIENLIGSLRNKWLHWSIEEGYRDITKEIRQLLPLLRQKYTNPILKSDAEIMDIQTTDSIPDEYIGFLYDVLIMLCTVYNIKIDQIRADNSLWSENADLMNDIHYIASFIFYSLGWDILKSVLQENHHSAHYLARELITGLNTFYFSLGEAETMKKRFQKKPPEKS